ncbi:MAG: hypothetical protein F4X50_00150 [Synechococcus sp. SB0662_bin_14]|nr:hypothetical protein [Synechococcus sp. SB0662_bin_14]
MQIFVTLVLLFAMLGFVTFLRFILRFIKSLIFNDRTEEKDIKKLKSTSKQDKESLIKALGNELPQKELDKINDKYGLLLKINYKDSKGNDTTRIIMPAKKVDLSELKELEYVKRYCYLRKGIRTFKTNRINECCNYSTGEVYIMDGQIL